MKNTGIAFLYSLLMIFSSMMLMTACQKKLVSSSPTAEPAYQGSQAVQAVTDNTVEDVVPDKELDLELERSRRLAEQMQALESENVFFDFDRSDLKPVYQVVLKKKAEWLLRNPAHAIRIEGHCDERGSTEYNLALGEKRAEAAKKFLITMGVPESQIKCISYGEERPAVPQSDDKAWEANRRDEFKFHMPLHSNAQ